jgi:hypothetical protein
VNRYLSKEYWTQWARNFVRSDEKGFVPVLDPGAPVRFNKSVVTSVWIEPIAEKICPEAVATNGVFLFQKEKAVG